MLFQNLMLQLIRGPKPPLKINCKFYQAGLKLCAARALFHPLLDAVGIAHTGVPAP